VYFLTGEPQSFTVPAGVVGVFVALSGGGGGAGCSAPCTDATNLVDGAPAGATYDSLATTPASTLELVVGGAGADVTEAGASEPAGGAGGYNGGGAGSANGDAGYAGGGGGGATDVGTGSCASTLSCTAWTLVAGGGGGSGGGDTSDEIGSGGDGGGATGATGGGADDTNGGGGGTQSGPGAAGGTAGSFPTAGNPGVGSVGGAGAMGGGGGGGGYYGGGGGGNSGENDGSGGGGGSGYAPAATSLDSGMGEPGGDDGEVYLLWETASALSATAGASVTLTANFGPTDLAGTETFAVGSTTLCSDVALAVVDGDASASCTTTALPVGTDDVTATLTPAPIGTGEIGGPLASTVNPTVDPLAGAAEVTAITVAGVPVPATGAGGSDGVPLLGLLLVVAGSGALLEGTRRRAR
jgi:hypothetical protein